MTDAQWHCLYFSDYLPLCIRIQGISLSHFCGSGALDGTDGRPLAPVAYQVRPVELGLSPLYPRVRLGRLAVPDGLPAGRSGSVRRAAGQHPRART